MNLAQSINQANFIINGYNNNFQDVYETLNQIMKNNEESISNTNKDTLNNQILNLKNEINKIDIYTENGIGLLNKTLKNAENIYNDKNSTQTDVDGEIEKYKKI